MSAPAPPRNHEEYEALAVAWAINALEPADQAAFEAHRDGCDRCALTVFATLEVAAELAYGVPDIAPPAQLRTRLLALAIPQSQPLPLVPARLPAGSSFDRDVEQRSADHDTSTGPAVTGDADITNQDVNTGPAGGPARDTDARDTDARDTDARDTDARDTDARDTDARDTDARDTDARDTDARDTDARDTDARDTDARDTDARDTDARDTDARDTDARDTDARDTDARDTDARDTDARDTDARDTDARDTDARDTDAREGTAGSTRGGRAADPGGHRNAPPWDARRPAGHGRGATRAPGPPRRRRQLVSALVAAVLIAGSVATTWAVTRSGPTPDRVAALSTGSGTVATVVAHRNGADVVTDALPPNTGRGTAYYVWEVPGGGGAPQAVGTFTVTTPGLHSYPVQLTRPLDGYPVLAISEERAGSTPTAPSSVLGKGALGTG